MEQFKARLTGKAPLIMHNGQLANPRNYYAKELAKVNKGKAKDAAACERLEFLGGLYLDEKGEPCVTADMMLANIIGGAKASKNGKEMKAGLYEAKQYFSLEYDGPRTADELYADPRFLDLRMVRVTTNKVLRCRPIFHKWAVTIEMMHDPDLIPAAFVKTAIQRAGLAIGLGDYRPRYGRYEVEVLS